MNWKMLKKKTWIDWVKIIVAIDIAGAGIGLILSLDIHIFGYFFRMIGLGFLSRIFVGVMYIFVAVLIFKRIFPQELAEEEHLEAKKMDEEIVDTTQTVKKAIKKAVKKAAQFTEKAQDKIDDVLDKSEDFFDKRKKEAKDEIDKLIKD